MNRKSVSVSSAEFEVQTFITGMVSRGCSIFGSMA